MGENLLSNIFYFGRKYSLLLFLITILLKTRNGCTVTIAEEVNAHLPDLQTADSNGPLAHYTHDYSPNERPEEIIDEPGAETSAILENQPDVQITEEFDPTIITKRPRRKRRRRRRKRPLKSDVPQILDTPEISTATEQNNKFFIDEPEQTGSEQIQKFNEPEQEKFLSPTNENLNLVRRRKRRRRPLKRPTSEEFENQQPTDDEKNQETKNGPTQKSGNEFLETEKEIEVAFSKLIATDSRRKPKFESDPNVQNKKELNQKSTIFDQNEKLSSTNSIPVLSIKSSSLQNISKNNLHQQQNSKNFVGYDNNKINNNNENETEKNGENKKPDKKDSALFKLRRLPPISSILRSTKPKSEIISEPQNFQNLSITEITTTPKNLAETTSTHITFTTSTKSESTTNKNNKNNFSKDQNYSSAEIINFEFPIIKYTGEKFSSTTSDPTTTTHVPTSTKKTLKINITNLCEYFSKKQESELTDLGLTDEEILKIINDFESSTTTTTTTKRPVGEKSESDMKKEILGLLNTKSGAERLRKILLTKNMTFEQLIDFSKNQNRVENSTSTTTPKNEIENFGTNLILRDILKEINRTEEWENDDQSKNLSREPKRYEETSPEFWNNFGNREKKFKPNLGISQEIILSYTSSTTENFLKTVSSFNLDSIDQEENNILLFNENDESAQFRNNIIRRKTVVPENGGGKKREKEFFEKRKVPVGMKTAIIISGAIFGVAVLGFFALLLSCKIRQKKSKLKRQQDILCSQYKNRDVRQSTRSISPVVEEPKYRNERIYPNIPANIPASNRHYYLWKTIRKTFQYD